MDPVKWLRKHNKQLLVWFGAILMIAFLVPNISLRGCGQVRRDEWFAQYQIPGGGKETIQYSSIQYTYRVLSAIRELGFDTIVGILPQEMLQNQFESLSGIKMMPAVLTRLMFFSESEMAKSLRDQMLSQVEDWTDDPAHQKQYRQAIESMADMNDQQRCQYFILLRQEALQMGLQATEEQVQALTEIRNQLIAANKLRPVDVQSVLNRNSLTETELKKGLGDYISILRYGSMIVAEPAISEQELRKQVYDQVRQTNIEGEYVEFDANLYKRKVDQPSEQEIQDHFLAYRSYQPGQTDPQNPHGFGYRLPDRVQVEYLTVDLRKVQAVKQQEFLAKPIEQRDETLQAYWKDPQGSLREVLYRFEREKKRKPQYGEIASKVESAWLKDEANRAGEQLIRQAMRLAEEFLRNHERNSDGSKQIKPTADYQKIASQLSTEAIPLETGKTEYFSEDISFRVRKFRDTFLIRNRQTLPDVLFNCKDLHEGRVSSLDDPPVEMNENIGPLITYDIYPTRYIPESMNMVRIVGIDPAREPVSIEDDGRQGNQKVQPLPESLLRQQVLSDVKLLKGYQLAKEHAEAIFQKVTDGQDLSALMETEDQFLIDPNDPRGGSSFLRKQNIGYWRRRMESIYQAMQKNPDKMEHYKKQLKRNQTYMRAALDAAGHAEADQSELKIAMIPEYSQVMIFQQIKVRDPYQEEYLRNKPLKVQGNLLEQEEPISVAFYDPENIKKRTHFKVRETSADMKKAPEEVELPLDEE